MIQSFQPFYNRPYSWGRTLCKTQVALLLHVDQAAPTPTMKSAIVY